MTCTWALLSLVAALNDMCVIAYTFKEKWNSCIYTPSSIINICDDTGIIIQSSSWRRENGRNYATRPIDQIPLRSLENIIQVREEFIS